MIRRFLLAISDRPAAQLARGDRLARSGAHREAIPLLARAAKAGLAPAQGLLGRAYLFGLGVPANLQNALGWLGPAAVANDPAAQTLLANLAILGVTKSQATPACGLFEAPPSPGAPDYHEVARWAVPAAEAGSAEAQALLAFVLDQGPEVLRDPPWAAALYRRAAEASWPQGQLGLALLLLRQAGGEDWNNTMREARDLLEAASATLPVAHYTLGLLAAADPRSGMPEAIRHFRAAAEQGHAPSQLQMGKALLEGAGVGPDPFAAETWLRRASLGGESGAAFLLGELYSRDGDPPPNLTEASLWYRRAAEGGHGAAACALGRLHLRGPFPDVSVAVSWLRRAAGQNDPGALNELAGLAVARQVPEADQHATFQWFARLALDGDAAAMFNVGLCFAEGVGVPRDDGQALACFSDAAASMPEAAFWCGRMMAEGRGAAADPREARACFLAAAASGLADAEAAAGEMLANGRGGERDLPRALALFTRAAAAGHLGAAHALRVLMAVDVPPVEITGLEQDRLS